MEVVLGDGTDITQWNALVSRGDSFSMLQSADWGNVKSELGWKAYRAGVVDGETLVAGAQMLVRKLPLGAGSLAYVPRGPLGRWQDRDVARVLFDALHGIAREHRAAFLKVEPVTTDRDETHAALSAMGFRASSFSNQPLATIVVDISPDDETILRSMRDSTRRKISSAQRKGVVVRQGDSSDLGTFYDLMRETAERTGATLRSRDYYENEFRAFSDADQAILLFAEHNGQTMAAHITYAYGEHAAFFHQASSSARSNLNPNSLLVWEQIKWAKSKGCRTYDLWGIPDEVGEIVSRGDEVPTDRTDGLWGVYRFKSGFSRNIVGYAGSFDYVYSPALYTLATSRLVNGTLERISSWMDGYEQRQT
jgi:lipid II:glycine glycyltransferase (peptidoglycan interpeptide bridge formation enzyme)